MSTDPSTTPGPSTPGSSTPGPATPGSVTPGPATPAPAAAAPPVVPPAHKNSFLKKLGQLGKDVVQKVLPVLTRAAVVAEPVVDLLFPLEGPLYNTVVTAIVEAEVRGAQAAAGAQTGPEKFEAVWKSVSPQLLSLANTNGLISADGEASVQKYIQSIFNILDGPVKATTPAAAPSAAATPTAPPTAS